MNLLKRHRNSLAGLPTAIFALGPLDTTEEAFARSRRHLDRSLAQVRRLGAASVGLFGGVDPRKRNGPDRRDARDWAAIQAWAEALPDLLRREHGATVTRSEAAPPVGPSATSATGATATMVPAEAFSVHG